MFKLRFRALFVLIVLAALLMGASLLLVGCGKDPTPTPVPTPLPLEIPNAEELQDMVVEAVLEGNAPEVEKLLDMGANPMTMTSLGPLPSVAASVGSTDVLGLLAKYGANLNAFDVEGLPPIHIATARGHLPAVEQLLDLGVDPNSLGRLDLGLGSPPLMTAIKTDQMEMADLLVNRGADLDFVDLNGMAPLNLAVTMGNMDMANLLVDGGANLDLLDGSGRSPLITAVDMGNMDMANMLIGSGAMLDLPGLGGMTPLHFAAMNDNIDMFGLLLDSGADVSIMDNNGVLPLEMGDILPYLGETDLGNLFPPLGELDLGSMMPGLGETDMDSLMDNLGDLDLDSLFPGQGGQ